MGAFQCEKTGNLKQELTGCLGNISICDSENKVAGEKKCTYSLVK